MERFLGVGCMCWEKRCENKLGWANPFPVRRHYLGSDQQPRALFTRPRPQRVRHGRPDTGPHLLAALNPQRNPIRWRRPRWSVRGGAGSSPARSSARSAESTFFPPAAGPGGGGLAGGPGRRAGSTEPRTNGTEGLCPSPRPAGPPGPAATARVPGSAPRKSRDGGARPACPLSSPRRTQQLRKDPAGRSVCLPRGGGKPSEGKLKIKKKKEKRRVAQASGAAAAAAVAGRLARGPAACAWIRVCVSVSACVCVSTARAGALTISPGERGHFGVGLEMLRLRLLPPRHAGSNISWGRIKNY